MAESNTLVVPAVTVLVRTLPNCTLLVSVTLPTTMQSLVMPERKTLTLIKPLACASTARRSMLDCGLAIK